jgi:hypothetical protein
LCWLLLLRLPEEASRWCCRAAKQRAGLFFCAAEVAEAEGHDGGEACDVRSCGQVQSERQWCVRQRRELRLFVDTRWGRDKDGSGHETMAQGGQASQSMGMLGREMSTRFAQCRRRACRSANCARVRFFDDEDTHGPATAEPAKTDLHLEVTNSFRAPARHWHLRSTMSSRQPRYAVRRYPYARCAR